jgi:hypothetical protein
MAKLIYIVSAENAKRSMPFVDSESCATIFLFGVLFEWSSHCLTMLFSHSAFDHYAVVFSYLMSQIFNNSFLLTPQGPEPLSYTWRQSPRIESRNEWTGSTWIVKLCHIWRQEKSVASARGVPLFRHWLCSLRISVVPRRHLTIPNG